MLKTLTLFILISPFSLFAAAFNGYVIKYKAAPKNSNLNLIKTTFGTFSHIKNLKQIKNKKSLNIQYIEPNYIYSKLEEESIKDKKFHYQWALQNRGSNSGDEKNPGTIGEDIKAIDAWKISKGSKDLKIAIIDSGTLISHPDLKENLWTNNAELSGKPGIDDDGNGYIDDIYGYNFTNNSPSPIDDDGHGTHCAGIIGASHNKIGVRGVLGKVQIISLKFLDESGNGDTINAIRAIDYAIAQNVKVISNSWGGGAYSKALYEAIKRAQDAGILFVVAAGNSSNDNDKNPIYPASYDLDNIVAVAASNEFGKKAKRSNYGEKSVDLFAPGNSILSTYLDDRYKRLTGTSMATPLVTGVLGLMYSVNSKLSYVEAKQLLLESVDKSRSLSYYSLSSGRLNALKAVQKSQ